MSNFGLYCVRSWFYQWYQWWPISFKVLPIVPLVIPLVPMVPLVKTDGSQYCTCCRQSTGWAKLPTLEKHMIKYGVLNFKFINFTNKHCFYQDYIRKQYKY